MIEEIANRVSSRQAISLADLFDLYSETAFGRFREMQDDILLGESDDAVKQAAHGLASGAAIRRI